VDGRIKIMMRIKSKRGIGIVAALAVAMVSCWGLNYKILAGRATVDTGGSTLAVVSNNGSAMSTRLVDWATVVGSSTNASDLYIFDVNGVWMHTIPAGSLAGFPLDPGPGNKIYLEDYTVKSATGSTGAGVIFPEERQ
jgi:hypothetical protein